MSEESKSPNLQTQSAKMCGSYTFISLSQRSYSPMPQQCHNVHIKPPRGSCSATPGSKKPRSLDFENDVFLELTNTSFFFAFVSLPKTKRCWKFVQPSESDSMATQQWTSGRVPIVPSWMFWQESQHLSEIGDQAQPHSPWQETRKFMQSPTPGRYKAPHSYLWKKLLLLKHKSEKRQTTGCSRNEVTRLVGGVVMRWGKPRWNHEISLFWFNFLESSMTNLWMWVSQNTHPRPKNQTRSYANRVFQIIFSYISSFSSLSRELYPHEFHQTLQNPAISLPMDTRVCVCINLCVPHHEQHVLGEQYYNFRIFRYLPTIGHLLVWCRLAMLMCLSKSCSGEMHVR